MKDRTSLLRSNAFRHLCEQSNCDKSSSDPILCSSSSNRNTVDGNYMADQRARLKEIRERSVTSSNSASSGNGATVQSLQQPWLQEQRQRLEQLRNSQRRTSSIINPPQDVQGKPQVQQLQSQRCESSSYEDFMLDLKRELASHHTDLWQGFQQNFFHLLPQKPLHHNYFEVTTPHNRNYRLHPSSKLILSAMHRYLKEHNPPHSHCALPQLIKERDNCNVNEVSSASLSASASISRVTAPTPLSSNHEVRLAEDGRSQTLGTSEIASLDENNIKEESLGKLSSTAAPATALVIDTINKEFKSSSKLPSKLTSRNSEFPSKIKDTSVECNGSKITGESVGSLSITAAPATAPVPIDLIGRKGTNSDIFPSTLTSLYSKTESKNRSTYTVLDGGESEGKLPSAEAPLTTPAKHDSGNRKFSNSDVVPSTLTDHANTRSKINSISVASIATTSEIQDIGAKAAAKSPLPIDPIGRKGTNSDIFPSTLTSLYSKTESKNRSTSTVLDGGESEGNLPSAEAPLTTPAKQDSGNRKLSNSDVVPSTLTSHANTRSKINSISVASISTTSEIHDIGATAAAKFLSTPLVKLKRVVNHPKPKLIRTASGSKVSPKEDMYSRKALRNVKRSPAPSRIQPLCTRLEFVEPFTEPEKPTCAQEESYQQRDVNSSPTEVYENVSTIQIGLRFPISNINSLFKQKIKKSEGIVSNFALSSPNGSILVLGEEVLCILQLCEHSNIAEVIWSSNRKAIASLTLVDNGKGAELTTNYVSESPQSSKKVYISFSSCLECLRFAQEFFGAKLSPLRSQEKNAIAKEIQSNGYSLWENMDSITSKDPNHISELSCAMELRHSSQRQPLFVEFSKESTDDRSSSSTEANYKRGGGNYDEEALVEKCLVTLRQFSPQKGSLDDQTTMKIMNHSIVRNHIESSEKKKSGEKCTKLSHEVRAVSFKIYLIERCLEILHTTLKTKIPTVGLRHRTKNGVSSVASDAFIVIEHGTDSTYRNLTPETQLLEKEEDACNKQNIRNTGSPKVGVSGKMAKFGFDSKIGECFPAIEKETMRCTTELHVDKAAKELIDLKTVEAILATERRTDSSSEGPLHAVLSKEEEELVFKYRKMLKMGIPIDGVRHKMTRDGVEGKIVDAVLVVEREANGGSSDDPRNATLSKEEEELIFKYRKMLKMGIPIDGVRHKMTRDGVDSKIIDAVLVVEKEANGGSSDDPRDAALSKEEEELVFKYRKMLKMGIPIDGVRHKMTKDGVEGKIVDAVLIVEKEASSGSSDDPRDATLSKEEEELVFKYRKMLKMGIPIDGVRHKMTKDGVDSKIVDAVLIVEQNTNGSCLGPYDKTSNEKGEPVDKYKELLEMHISKDAVLNVISASKFVAAVRGSEEKMTPKSRLANTTVPLTAVKSNLVGFHWTPLSPKALESSIWGTYMNSKRLNPGDSEILELEKFFQKKNITKTPVKEGYLKGGGPEHKLARLIDLTRANNISITLKAFKEFSLEELVAIIDDLDPERKIAGERTQNIKQLLPHPQELLAVKNYKGGNNLLVPAEIFFRHLLKVKRPDAKFHVMQVMNSFSDSALETERKLDVLSNVCTQVLKSERLKRILGSVLSIGNKLNEGTRTGGVAGFKFESLLKLTQTKSSDGKMTVLDYLVRAFVKRNERHMLALDLEFPCCQEASKIKINEIVGDVQSLQASIQNCRKELELMKSDQRGKSDQKQTHCTSHDDKRLLLPDCSKAAKDLLNDTQKRDGHEWKKESGRPNGMPAGFLAELQSRKTKSIKGEIKKECNAGRESTECLENRAMQQIFSPGVERLDHFLSDAENTLMLLKDKEQFTIEACRNMAKHLGEPGGEKSATSILVVLSDFVTTLHDSLRKHDEREEVKKRENEAKTRIQKQSTPVSIMPASGFKHMDTLFPPSSSLTNFNGLEIGKKHENANELAHSMKENITPFVRKSKTFPKSTISTKKQYSIIERGGRKDLNITIVSDSQEINNGTSNNTHIV